MPTSGKRALTECTLVRDPLARSVRADHLAQFEHGANDLSPRHGERVAELASLGGQRSAEGGHAGNMFAIQQTVVE